MKRAMGQLKWLCAAIVSQRIPSWKWISTGLGTLVIFQIHFVRQLLAAELLFGLGFAVLLALAGVIYLIGILGERGLNWAEAGVRVLAEQTRRGLANLEEISRKPFRHPRSESAQ